MPKGLVTKDVKGASRREAGFRISHSPKKVVDSIEAVGLTLGELCIEAIETGEDHRATADIRLRVQHWDLAGRYERRILTIVEEGYDPGMGEETDVPLQPNRDDSAGVPVAELAVGGSGRMSLSGSTGADAVANVA